MAGKYDRILVVDDDEMMRDSLTEILTNKGYTVESANSAEKAIEKMKKWPVHLFLLDIQLPGMSGIELLKKLDIKNNSYEAIIITGYTDMDSAKEAMELGAFSYISKPVLFKDLAPVVKKALEIVAQKRVKLDYLDELEKKVEERTKKLEREIAERKKAENVLRESEDKYSTLVEQSKDAVLIIQDGACVFANKAAATITGYKNKELLGDNFWKYLAQESRERVAEMYKNRMAGRKAPTTYEVVIKHKDGTDRISEITAGVIQYMGKPAVMGTLRDITERKKAEKALIKSEERYRRLFEESNDAIFIHNAKGEILDVNKAACEMLGYDRRTLTVLKIHMLHPSKEKPKAKSAMKNMAKTRKVWFESKFKKADGTIIDVEISARIIKDEENDNNLIQGIVRDITERKQAEDALKESEEKMRAILDASPDVIHLLDSNGTILSSNEGFTKRMGTGMDDVIGKNVFDYGPTESVHNRKAAVDKVFRTGEPVQLEDKGLTGVFESHIHPVFNPAGEVTAVAVYARDITEHKQAEKALRENESKLSEQNIMLREKNIALREVMDQLEAEKDRLGKQVNTNIDRLLLPLTAKLRSKGSKLDKTYLDLLEDNLRELTSQFGSKMSDRMLRLTQKEIEICNMIKSGLSSKEIANLLNVSYRTIETHRNNIRKKLGIGKQEVNLVTFLKNV